MTNDSVTSSIKKMLGYFQDLRQLLDEDKNNFIKKDMASIEESNHKKSLLLDNLAQLVNQLNASSTEDTHFLEAIGKKSTELKSLTSTLEAEMIQCYSSLTVNNKIVFTNIQRLKEFWGKLSLLNTETECVYDQKANTSNK